MTLDESSADPIRIEFFGKEMKDFFSE